MFLSKEDYNSLAQVQLVLARVLKNAVMSELEEAHERKFDRLLSDNNIKSAFNLIYKELRRMSINIKEIFNEEWFEKHLRRKPSGIYEIRCTVNKVAVSGSGKTLERAAINFIAKLSEIDKANKTKPQARKKVLFNDFAEKWFTVVKKPNVKQNTYEMYYEVYAVHIKPFLKGKVVEELTAMQIQPLFTRLTKMKILRTAQIVRVLLNQIFQSAVGERLIEYNPMDGVKVLKHKPKNGCALTVEEEREFLRRLEGSGYELTYALMIFCGMRRGELASARIKGGFIIVDDGKVRLGQEKTKRKIPITPMLERYLNGVNAKSFKAAIGFSVDHLSKIFRKLCTNHHLHDLRHTFITRCQECGVPREVVSVWAGHAADNTMTSTVYTHFSEEFMISEGRKVDYYNRLNS